VDLIQRKVLDHLLRLLAPVLLPLGLIDQADEAVGREVVAAEDDGETGVLLLAGDGQALIR